MRNFGARAAREKAKIPRRVRTSNSMRTAAASHPHPHPCPIQTSARSSPFNLQRRRLEPGLASQSTSTSCTRCARRRTANPKRPRALARTRISTTQVATQPDARHALPLPFGADSRAYPRLHRSWCPNEPKKIEPSCVFAPRGR
ncbi:hypothetical protein MSAN_02466800 [Mycena sanguinolenta]|uniref:Uncharacterized protein n=1 Tax=Mycena sanguinolenta TaxID=230812 RepID=A0A8H7CC29_9AGAR|nr:hypothetical protein MSAN_02466800 [Mycena sanguinolenta]